MPNNLKGYSGFMPESLFKKITDLKKVTGKTLQEIIIEAVTLYLKENKPKKLPVKKIKKKIVRK